MDYFKVNLIAEADRIFDSNGKYICTISSTDKLKRLIDGEGWNKSEESWIDYRGRTAHLRDQEHKRAHSLARDLVDAYNEKNNLS